MSITIKEPQSGYTLLVTEFKNAFNPIVGFMLRNGRNYLKLEGKKLPEYLKLAIKRDYIKDIKEIEVKNLDIALEVTFIYEDGTKKVFESNTLLFKQDKNNACRIVEWMLNLKSINE